MNNPKRVSALFFVLMMGSGLAHAVDPQLKTAYAPNPNAVDDSDRVILPGSVHPLAQPESDIGPVDPAMPMDRIILSLKLRAGAQAELDKLLDDQQDTNSPLFHHWLTPEEFGARFGISDSEINRIIDWLQSHGLAVEGPAKGKGWIIFSGSAAQLEETFTTEIHEYWVDGELHHANSEPVSIPRAFADVMNGPVSLHDFWPKARRPALPKWKEAVAFPMFTQGGIHFLAPKDFWTIYDLQPLLNSSVNGAGVEIAIAGQSDVDLNDVRLFRSNFGLPPRDPVIYHNGFDPGLTNNDEQGEADLDVEWAGAIAPGAIIDLVVTASSSGGALFSATWAVEHLSAAIISISFGQCEAFLSASTRAQLSLLYAEASAGGQTIVVASGDSGVATCDPATNLLAIGGPAINGYCSTPYAVCVGGTQFLDQQNPSMYWNSQSDPIFKSSAKSYIPEQAWNESGLVAGGAGLWSSGGGASTLFSKPTWQNLLGVPSDGARDVPDISFSAANHDCFLIYTKSGSLECWHGTSASAPAFAGIAALIVQKTGTLQGTLNPRLYQLAGAQYSGSGPTVFHDVTTGNNSVPGQPGYFCGTGYDLVTGLGSVDATALVNNWVPAGNLPNLTPYKPTGWSDKIVVTTQAGSTTDASSITSADNLLVDWAVINSSNVSITTSFVTQLLIDGSLRQFWTSNPPVPSNNYAYVTDYSIGTLSTGTHTLTIIGDSSNSVVESNEGDNSYTKTIHVLPAGGGSPCAPNSTTLCFLSGRFSATVTWRNQHANPATTGFGNAVVDTDQTGFFWFFAPGSKELVVKMIDGNGFNGKFWVFYGALSDVEYTITITDTHTGLTKNYHNIPGNICGGADTSAFSP